MATRLFSTSPRVLAWTRYLDMVWTPKQAFLARFLESIQKPRGISSIAFSALLIFVTFVKTPPLLRKSYYNIRCRFYWLKKVPTITHPTCALWRIWDLRIHLTYTSNKTENTPSLSMNLLECFHRSFVVCVFGVYATVWRAHFVL